MPSIDNVLATSGKPLKPGASVSFTLVKGCETTSQDPLDPSAPPVIFPAVAKFGLSVEKPDLSLEYRMFEQKVPEAKDDSDDEDVTSTQEATRRKRRRAPKLPRREWIYEPENEFQEEIGATKNTSGQGVQDDQKKTRLRYVGAPENNSSSYVILSVDPGGENVLRVTPVSGFYSFQQPGKTPTLSMQEAENMINDQRATTTRYMMRAKAAAAGITAAPAMSMVRPDASKGSAGLSRIRLLGKLSNIGGVGPGQTQEEDDDDVMSDLKFKSRKKGSRARQELISTLGEGLAVDDDGVLGGTNDGLFGGRRNFSRIAQSVDRGRTPSASGGNEKGADLGERTSKQVAESAEGAAMGDDFFQRDVSAEYDQLDFDANEQFDDDDVDQVEDNDGGGGFVNDEEDDDLDEEDDDEGIGGLASVAGLKALMAKAGGEQSSPDEKVNPAEVDSRGRKTTAYNLDTPADGGEDATGSESKDQASEDEERGDNQTGPRKKARVVGKPLLANKDGDALGMDAQGNRIISLESVRREIWLHHGQIKTKQLLKIFNVKKRSAEQKKFFNELVKELCTMSKTVEGNVLVLKQHYAK